MSNQQRYIQQIPNGVGLGGIITFILSIIPFVSFVAPFVGGLIATYMEEYGILYSIGAGVLMGLISLIPVTLFFGISAVVLGGGALADSASIGILGGLSTLFGGVYIFAAILINPVMGVLGGITLGIYFHLIHKATD